MQSDGGTGGSVLLLLAFILFAVAYWTWCCVRIVARTGLSPFWAALMIVPGLNLVLIWLFAYARWPRLDARAPIPPEDNRYMPPRPGAR